MAEAVGERLRRDRGRASAELGARTRDARAQRKNISKSYPTPRGALPILADVSLSLDRGDAVAIMGPSGSGKSTLLYILGALEPPSAARSRSTARIPYALGERAQAAFRNRTIGFVFQDHSLLPQCSVLENVLTPTLVARRREAARPAIRRARASCSTQVGLGDRLDHRPASSPAARSSAPRSPAR